MHIPYCIDDSFQEHGTSNGWPLGLEVMSMRLRVNETVQSAPAVHPFSFHVPSSSFSSFSSSNLDTESTASFFQDNSVSLGRLIGFRHRDGGRGTLYLPNSLPIEEHSRIPVRGTCKDVSKEQSVDMSQGICIPLLLGVLVKMNRSKSKVKQFDV
ncbi:hypothetical protein SLE2022_011530 [Rubroshorea leprosula]